MHFIAVLLVSQFINFQGDEAGVAILAKDGTVLIAKVKFNEFEIKTEFGTQKVPIKEIKYIKAGKEDFEIKTRKSTLKGKITPEDFIIESSHGLLKINAKDIDKIVPTKGKIAINDDNVIGFWDFAGDEEVTLNSSKYVDEEGISAVKIDTSDGKGIDIPHKDEFNLTKAYTIEMRFKFEGGLGMGGYLFIISKPVGGYQNYAIQFSPSEKIMYAWSHTKNGGYGQLQANSVTLEENKWHHLAVTADEDKNKVCIYLDGKSLEGNYSGKLEDFKTGDLPIKLFSQGSGMKAIFLLDFLRISRVAKSEEEIKESAEFGGISGISKKLVDQGNDAQIVAKTGEKYSCKIENEKISVEAGIGTVQVNAKAISKISFFEYRENQINEMHKKAKDLIQNLGDSDPEKRDGAQDELKKLGWVVIPVLEENKDHQDEEIKNRIRKLLEGYNNKKYEISKDRIEGDGLLLKGWIKDDSIKAKTKYGDINIQSKDIRYITISNQSVKIDASLSVQFKDGSILGGSFLAESLKMNTEYGELKVPFKNIINITLGKDDEVVTTTTSTIVGKIIGEEFEFESQIGKITLKKSDVVKISKGSIKETKTSEDPPKSNKLKDIEKRLKELKEKFKEAPEGSDLREKLIKELAKLEEEYVRLSKSDKMIEQLKKEMEAIQRKLKEDDSNGKQRALLESKLEELQKKLAELEKSR